MSSYTLKSVTQTSIPLTPSAGDAYYLPSGAAAANPGTDWADIGDDSIAELLDTGAWVGRSMSRTQIYEVEDQPASGANAQMLYQGPDSFAYVGNSADYNTSQTWFVSGSANHSDDANAGRSPLSPKATIASALSAAASAGPSVSTPHVVVVLDGDAYTEDITLAANVILRAPSATLNGSILMDGGCSVSVFRHTHSAAGDAVDLNSTNATAYYRSLISGFTGSSNGFECAPSGSVLILDCQSASIAAGSGTACVGSSSTNGKITGRVASLKVGTNCVGIDQAASGGGIHVTGEEISRSGAATGTTALKCSLGIASASFARINCATAYNISGGTLSLSCPDINGTATSSGGSLDLDFRTDGSRAMTGDLDMAGSDVLLGSGGLTATGASHGDILEFDGTRFDDAIHHPEFFGRATTAQTGWGATTATLEVDAEDAEEGGLFTHDATGVGTPKGEVTIGASIVAEVSFCVQAECTSIGVALALVQEDTGSGWTSIAHMGVNFPVENAVITPPFTLSLPPVRRAYSNGDKVRVLLGRNSAVGAFNTLGGGDGASFLRIKTIRVAS